MKSCPTCNRTYPDDTLAFCLVDGSVLSAPYDPGLRGQAASAPGSSGEPTQVLTPSLQPTITSQPRPELLAQRQADTSPERRGNKLLLVGIVSAVFVIIVIVVGLYFVWPSPSLGAYKGSLKELFPKSMGSYQLNDSRQEFNIKNQLMATDSWFASYQQQTNATNLFPDLVQSVEAQAMPREAQTFIIALNFSSVENARTGLQSFRKALADATIVDQGTKQKGRHTVGDRVVLIPHQDLVQRDDDLRSDGVRFIRTQGSSVLVSEAKVVA
ncbi:MAG: hypothetical protein AABM67_13045, partial [Acidobacteriota bacterium]